MLSFEFNRAGSAHNPTDATRKGQCLTKFGRYDVVAKIGEGGFGEVFEAYDPDLKRRVAIKTCSSQDAELIARFEQEAALAGSLHHRNLTATYDFSTEDGTPYLVQEFLEGEDLDQKIAREEDLSVTTKLQYLIQLARGLRHAHSRRVIHRDVKPSNVRVLPDGQIKLMDFGIAQSLDNDAQLTLAGETMGTAAYLAPEQIRGEKVDERCDIYSFGVTAYELFCLERPFPGDDSDAVLVAAMESAPAPITQHWSGCPDALSTLVQRCMEKDPSDRHHDFGSVLADFDAILGEDSAQRPAEDFSRSTEGSPDFDLGTVTTDQASGADPPVVSLAIAREDEPKDDSERTQQLDQPIMVHKANPDLVKPQEHRPRPTRAGSAVEALQAAVEAPQGAVEAPQGPSLMRLVVGLALMGVLGAVAATWFFGRPIPPEAPRDLPTASAASPVHAGDVQASEDLASRSTEPAKTTASPLEDGVVATVPLELGTLLVEPAWNPEMTALVRGRTLSLRRTQQVKLPPGEHTVLFSLEDDPDTSWNESQSERRQVSIHANQETLVKTRLERPGAVTIRAALGASQAFIRIDDDPIGWAPISEQPMPPGNYQVSASTSATETVNATSFPLIVNSAEETIITVNVDSKESPVTSTKPWAPQ